MECKILLPSTPIFEGAQPVDCGRQSLITLTTEKIEDKDIVTYLQQILPELSSENTQNMVLDELLLVIKQCFKRTNPSIVEILSSYLQEGSKSRANLLASIVALNSVVSAKEDYKIDDKTIEFLNKISDQLAPQFHSFKPRKLYNVFGFNLTQTEAISIMLSLINLIPITTEAVLEAALFLWHSSLPQAESINFIELLSNVQPQLFRALFESIPRERFLFLCSDPQAPSTICPSISTKLDDFSDVPFFLKALPLPQLHLSDETIGNAIETIKDCHILTPRLHHNLLQKVSTWVNILTYMDESSIINSAKCFVTNIVDVADTVAQLLLALPNINSIDCKFIDEVLNQDTEARSQLSRSEMLSFVISNLQRPPPIEFWQMIFSPEPFKHLEGIEIGQYPVAFLGLVHYLISSNRIFNESFFKTLSLPSIEDEETKSQLCTYIKSLDGKPATLFGNVPQNNNITLLVSIAIFDALNFPIKGKTQILNYNEQNMLPYLAIQLSAIKSLIDDNRFIESFLVNKQENLDSVQKLIKKLKENISELDDLCICTIFDVLASYHPFYNSPSVISNIILLTSYLWFNNTYKASKGVNTRFCRSLHLLDQVLIYKPHGNRIAYQILTVFTHFGTNDSDSFLHYLKDNSENFYSKKLDILHFFDNDEELCNKACSKFLTENSSIETIVFFQRCFINPPKVTINSPEKAESLYRGIVTKEQWNDATYIASFLANSGQLEIIKPTTDEIINILIHSRVPFDEGVPNSLLSLIQYKLRDDDTQLNAMVNYFLSSPETNIIDITKALLSFSRFFKCKPELIEKALATVCVRGLDPSNPLIRRPEPQDLPTSSAESLQFVEKLVDACITNPTQKMFIFLRATIVRYSFLFRGLEKEKCVQLFEACFSIIDDFEKLDSKEIDYDTFNHIQASILLLSAFLTEPKMTDYFFEYFTMNIEKMTSSRIYISLHFFDSLFNSSRFLAALSSSYFFKNDLFAKISTSVLRVCDNKEESKLKESVLTVYNQLIESSLSFFSNLAEIDVVDIDESLKINEFPFNALVQPSQMRSALTLAPIKAFGPYEVTEDHNLFTDMANVILPPQEGPELDIRGLLSSFSKSEGQPNDPFKPADVDTYIQFLPEIIGISKDDYKKLSLVDQSILLLKHMPKLQYITTPMMRVLLRQPTWIKINILQKSATQLLLPEHYIILMQVLQEMKNIVKDDGIDLNNKRRDFISNAFCQENFFNIVTLVFSQKNLKKDILVNTLDNLSTMLSFGPALDKCAEFIVPLLHSSDQIATQITDDNLMLAYTILMVMAKTGAGCEKLYSILCDDFFIYFLQPRWRNDKHKLELISALVTTFIEKEFNRKLVLPSRIIHFICFLYMNDLYRTASSISLYLSDDQKKLISPFIHHVYDHLRSLEATEDTKVDLMQLCRAYPFLNFDKTRALTAFDLLLSQFTNRKTTLRDLEMLVSLINVLIPDELIEIDEKEEKKNREGEGLVAPLSFPLPISVYKKFPSFWRVISKQRVNLTKIAHSLRFSQNATSSFKFLFMFPIILDLQLKIDYFNYLNKKSIEGTSGVCKIEIKNDENALKNSYDQITGGDGSDPHVYEGWRKEFTPTILDSDRSWYEVICQDIFSSDLFILSPNNRCVMINPKNTNLDMFRFAGFFVALSLLHNQKINAHLAPNIFKRILGIGLTLRDVEIADVILARSYRHILEQPASNLGLFFTATSNNDNKEVELIQNGSKIAVNEENKEQYVQLMINFRLENEIKNQLDAFCEGFYSIVKKKDVLMFNAEELEMLVCGVPKIDIDDMSKNVIIHSPYSLEHPLIKRFFKMLRRWDQATLGKLLWFVTGSSELPIGGFAELKKKGLTIQIERGTDLSFTPEAHTCFQTLIIPDYPSLDLMERMFFLALDENV